MSFGKLIGKEVKKLASGVVKSEIRSNAKFGLKSVIKKLTGKSPEDAAREVEERLGYLSEHYTKNADNEISFKSSPLLVHEWLTRAPEFQGNLIKDLETGIVYLNKEEVNDEQRIDLMSSFAKKTGILSPSLNSHFIKAFELLPSSDYTSVRFGEVLGDWEERKKVIGKDSVIDEFLVKSFSGLQTDPVYATKLFRKWVIGTARRAMQPGTVMDGCFTIQGEAGTGKTLFFRNLLPTPFDGRTGEIYCDIKSPREFIESIVGKTIACFDELAGIKDPKLREVFKQLITTQKIQVRMAYNRKQTEYKLRQGFCATTNHKESFIQERAISRRIWVIEVGDKRLDFDYFMDNRADLWREAVYLANKGESCFLTPEEQIEVEKNNLKFLKGGSNV